MYTKKFLILLGCITTTLLTGCGNKNTGNIIPTGDEAPAIAETAADEQNPADPELITERVNAIYEAVAAAYPEVHDISPSNDELDDAYCSAEWKTIVSMVNSKDAENMGREGFFDADYWIMGQDWDKISISDVKVAIKDATHADATLTLHNFTDIKVKLEMVFEQGEWMIGNFVDQTHNTDWKKNMMKYLEEKGKKAAEEKSDDGIIEYDIN